MHSLSPYLFRCYNSVLSGRREERYSSLDNLNNEDLFYLLRDFINSKSSSLNIVEDSKQVFQFEMISLDEENREITAWFNVGTYGMKTDIVDIETGLVDYKKTKEKSEIIKYYIHFFIPAGFNEGMAFMHSYRGIGVKTLFMGQFSDYFRQKTNLVIQMNPLAYDKAVYAWLDASAKEVKLTKFKGLSDIADQVKKLGHSEQELVFKAPRNGSLGKLRDYLTGDKYNAVEIIGEFGSKVRTVVEMNGKRRTFSIGKSSSTPLCEIEMEEALIDESGIPDHSRVKSWVKGIIKEYSYSMYPGLHIEAK